MAVLKENIIKSYDMAMDPYLTSETKKKIDLEAALEYNRFEKNLGCCDPELRQEFTKLMTKIEKIAQTEKEEAYYRGVMTGITEYDNFK